MVTPVFRFDAIDMQTNDKIKRGKPKA
jgi:hypothetical protein